MKLIIYSLFLLTCFSIFSCSHNPYKSFQEIQVGNDKEEVLQKVGSPLRSFHRDGKDIWTYRFYSKTDDNMIYKDLILDNEKVLEIRDSKEVDIKEIERKEKLVEQSLRETIKARESVPPTNQKPKVDDSFLNEISKKKNSDSTFKPVE